MVVTISPLPFVVGGMPTGSQRNVKEAENKKLKI
jgi:hypothetical protein